MPITPETVQRLTAGVAQLVRTGRRLSAHAATRITGELPSFAWTLLVPLERVADQRTSDLAAQAGVDVSVASRQLGCLERLGHVARRPDPADGRATLYRLTSEGADALAAARALRAEWAGAALAGWADADGRLLADLLDRLVTDLDQAARPLHAASTAHGAGSQPVAR
jgi:DNA-binding MarR family transcriptional regulator